MNEERWSENPYYSPKKCGLQIIDALEDPAASYDFSTVVAFRKSRTKRVFIVHDSGCSCPTPFEDVHSLADMSEIRTVKEAREFIQGVYTKYRLEDIDTFLERVGKILRKKRKKT